MNTTSIGRAAEQLTADYLVRHEFKILAQNWRTRWCEIDLITYRADTIYFIEVKYRSSSNNGSGIDYITPSKLQRMIRAAERWIQLKKWNGAYELAVADVTGTTSPGIVLTPITDVW